MVVGLKLVLGEEYFLGQMRIDPVIEGAATNTDSSCVLSRCTAFNDHVQVESH